jgi:hypothetical protein
MQVEARRFEVIALKQYRSLPQFRIAVAVRSALLFAGLLGVSPMASAQDQGAAIAKDAIFARKTVMSTLSDKMDQIEAMIAAGKIKLDQGHDLADTISVMFMALPHLFPPSTNQWKAGADIDPATDNLRLAGRVDQLFGLLSASRQRLEDCIQHQPR